MGINWRLTGIRKQAAIYRRSDFSCIVPNCWRFILHVLLVVVIIILDWNLHHESHSHPRPDDHLAKT